jgi:phosphoribosyl-ATP pyrophosphohydrolase
VAQWPRRGARTSRDGGVDAPAPMVQSAPMNPVSVDQDDAMNDRDDIPASAVIDRLFAVIEARRDADPSTSHTAKLFAKGTRKIAQKAGEEAVELVIEAVRGKRDRIVEESADLMYHLLVLWADARVRPGDVWAELMRREGVSGIAEKAARTENREDG